MTGAGRVVGVTADRRADEQAVLLRRYGLDVLHGPMLATVVVAGEGPLRHVTADLIEAPPDILVANTGIGIRTWFAAARDWGLEAALLAALAPVRIAARGPKVAGAIRSAGLEVWWRAPSEQLADVRDHLLDVGVSATRVAVQRHGEDAAGLRDALVAGGATVIEIPVYRWEVPVESGPATALIEAVIERSLDALTFTSGPAIRNMMQLARRLGVADDVLAAVNGPPAPLLVACVGPVCAGVAREEGFLDVIVPEHWRLGSLVRVVAEELDRRSAGVASDR